MALPSINFVTGQGGLGRALAGEDYISGLFFIGVAVPFLATPKQFFSYSQFTESVPNDNSDVTASDMDLDITVIGTNGNTATILLANPFLGTTTSVVYTKSASETTLTLVASAIKDLINANTDTHGYSAVSTVANVSITAPKSYGVALNTTTLSVTFTGTLAGTTSAWSNGTATIKAHLHYQVSEYFRIQPQGQLYVQSLATASADYNEIYTMQNVANGTIRQIAVVEKDVFATSMVTTLQTKVNLIDSEYKYTSVVLGADFSSLNYTTLPSLSLNSNKVSVCLGADAGNLGKNTALAIGKSVTSVGVCLGAVSLAKVSDCIGWIAKFNVGLGKELDVLRLATGDLLTSLSLSALNALNNLGYVFLRKQLGIQGSYFVDSNTCIVASSDFAKIENNRTIDKAKRVVRTALLPELNSPIVLNSDGTIKDTTISYLEGLCETALDELIRNTEISAYDVVINPAQNVLSTSEIVVSISIVPVGVARTITVNIGFVLSI